MPEIDYGLAVNNFVIRLDLVSLFCFLAVPTYAQNYVFKIKTIIISLKTECFIEV